jgi:hypothetical protein
MLSKVLATLVATMAVAFAGYTLVSDSSGCHSCPSTMVMPVTSSDSCCESAAALPSCCQESAVTADAASTAVCPADKIAAPAKEKAPDGDK